MLSKKRFLKPFAVFMAILMLASLATMSGAANNNTKPNIIIGDDVPADKVDLIIATINGEVLISPHSILCLIPGHNLATTTVRAVTCKVWATAPRCREVTYRITYCTRTGCNYAVSTIIGEFRIHCCP